MGSDRWAPKEVDGKTVNQCNIFVADKLHESGAPMPNVGGRAGVLGPETSDWLNAKTDGRIGGQAPSANDWHQGKVPGYEQVDGAPKPGDIASDGKHVGIVNGEGKTISASSKTGTVVESDWGFRSGQNPVTFWRYSRMQQGKQ